MSAHPTHGHSDPSGSVEHLLGRLRRLGSLPVAARLLITTFVVAAAFAARLAIEQPVDGHRFIFFLPAVIAAAVLFDRLCWLYAMVLSMLLIDYFFTPPIHGFGTDDPAELLATLLFFGVGGVIAVSVEGFKATTARLGAANAELRQLVERLAASEEQKSVLLREINHRIKNDLQSITSALNIQARAQADDQARSALEATAARIRVLGRVYARLHLEPDALIAVEIQDFVNRLCHDFRTSLIGLRPITLRVEVESAEVALSRAVPIGLIINELATNALKHAFPEDRPGTIAIRFRRCGSEFCLSVSDDGIGLGPSVPTHGLGQRLVRALVQQLGGRLDVDGSPGVSVTVRFPAQ